MFTKRQLQKTPTSEGGDECGCDPFSRGVQTPAEIEELRLRPSHPVKTPE